MSNLIYFLLFENKTQAFWSLCIICFTGKNDIIIALRTVYRENAVGFGYFYFNPNQFLCAIKEFVFGLGRTILDTTVASNCAALWDKTKSLLIIDDWINKEETGGRCLLESFLKS